MAETGNTVERTLSILEAVAHSKNGMTNSDINRRLKIPKSSASYILRVLENRGYLMRDSDTGKYRLGLKLMSLSRDMLTHIDVREIAKPEMENLVNRLKLSVHLAVLDNGRAVYVEKVEAEGFVRMDIWVGHRLPIHTTAIGKVLVSQMTENEILNLLKLRGMERKTPKSITSAQKYLVELEKVRRQGYAVDNEENSVGVRCVATPIYDSNGKIVASIGTSNTIIRIDEKHLPSIVEILKKSAAKISANMGYQN